MSPEERKGLGMQKQVSGCKFQATREILMHLSKRFLGSREALVLVCKM